MASTAQDQDALDQLKFIWNQGGKWVALAIGVIALSFIGIKAKEAMDDHASKKASNLYMTVEAAFEKKNLDALTVATMNMQKEAPKAPFTVRASYLLAELAQERKQLDAVTQSLQWVIAHAAEPAATTMAKLRLAAVYLDQKKYTEANALLQGDLAQGFESLVWDMRGNIMMAQNDKPAAIKAYQEAFQLLTQNDALYGILELKLAALMALPEAAVQTIQNDTVLAQ